MQLYQMTIQDLVNSSVYFKEISENMGNDAMNLAHEVVPEIGRLLGTEKPVYRIVPSTPTIKSMTRIQPMKPVEIDIEFKERITPRLYDAITVFHWCLPGLVAWSCSDFVWTLIGVNWVNEEEFVNRLNLALWRLYLKFGVTCIDASCGWAGRKKDAKEKGGKMVCPCCEGCLSG